MDKCFGCDNLSVYEFTGQFSSTKRIKIYTCSKIEPPRILCDKGIEGIPHWCPLGVSDG
jgi:hypothetical protein